MTVRDAGWGPRAMRATSLRDQAAPAAAGVLRLVVTTRGDAGDGELVVHRTAGRASRTALTAPQVRGLLAQWAAARAVRGELLVGE
jgi:hypothetical protein